MKRCYEIRRRHQWGGGFEWARCLQLPETRMGQPILWCMVIHGVVYPLARGARAAANRDRVASGVEL